MENKWKPFVDPSDLFAPFRIAGEWKPTATTSGSSTVLNMQKRAQHMQVTTRFAVHVASQ